MYREPDETTIAAQTQPTGGLKGKNTKNEIEQPLDGDSLPSDDVTFDSSEILKNCSGVSTMVVVTKVLTTFSIVLSATLHVFDLPDRRHDPIGKRKRLQGRSFRLHSVLVETVLFGT